MTAATYGLALAAGVLSTLSPCVLPILPVVIGTAASEHKYGPVALAAGLAISFVTIGMFVATIGFAIGIDGAFFRSLSAILLIGIGAVLMSTFLQGAVAGAVTPLSNWAGSRFGGAALASVRAVFWRTQSE